MAGNDALLATWQEQARWSAIAGKLKRRLVNWRRAILLSLIVAAVLAALAGHIDSNAGLQTGLGVTSVVVVVAVPFVRAAVLSKGAFQNWTRARSASEALKQEVYEYLTGTGTYRDASGRDRALDAATAGIVERVADLGEIVPLGDARRRPAPEPMDPATYLQDRVKSQLENYYRPKAAVMARRERALRRWEWILAGVAVLAVVVTAAAGWSSAIGWIGVVTTTSGSLLAHREAERYEYLAISYTVTAKRLEAVHAHWLAAINDHTLHPAEEDRLVTEAEDAISVENQAWMATWIDAPRGV